MPKRPAPPLDLDYLKRRRWWSNVAVGASGECWPWLRSTGSHGYGQSYDGITVRLAHRIAWALTNEAQIPDDMTIDHLCHNRICCNPTHLRVLTNVDNATDNLQGSKMSCPRGHNYDTTNTYINRKGHRICRACAKLRRGF
jgi:hypothetical protein